MDDCREIFWVGDSRKMLCSFPEPVKDEIGYAIHLAQSGEKHPNAKPLKIPGEVGVFEVVSNFNTNTYRGIYAIKIDEYIYVLDAFQKKSKKGIATPKVDIDRIRQRLAIAKQFSNGGKSYEYEIKS